MYGEDMHCPMWNCMSELMMTLATIFIAQLTVQQAMEVGSPLLKQMWQRIRTRRDRSLTWSETKNLEVGIANLTEPKKSEEEAQSLLPEYPGVLDDYTVLIFTLACSPSS